jgi:hypothetical protein
LARVDDAEGPRRAAEINLDWHERAVPVALFTLSCSFQPILLLKTFRD